MYWNNSFINDNSVVGIEQDDITTDDIKYKGTNDLWRLLTYVYKLRDDLCTENHLKIIQEYCLIKVFQNILFQNIVWNSKDKY